MADNSNLHSAKKAKNDEFYTRYCDIEAEMNAYVEYNKDVFRGKTILCPCDDPEWSNFTRYFAANFTRFGMKKLISTSYAKSASNRQMTIFEQNSPMYDVAKHETHGKVFILTSDTNGNGIVDTDDIRFSDYLEGDGDFRSDEVTALRDEADIIITNPPVLPVQGVPCLDSRGGQEVRDSWQHECHHVQGGLPTLEGRFRLAWDDETARVHHTER